MLQYLTFVCKTIHFKGFNYFLNQILYQEVKSTKNKNCKPQELSRSITCCKITVLDANHLYQIELLSYILLIAKKQFHLLNHTLLLYPCVSKQHTCTTLIFNMSWFTGVYRKTAIFVQMLSDSFYNRHLQSTTIL